MKASSLVINKDSESLAEQAARFVAACSQEAIQERGRFTIALSGGSTPAGMYTYLAEHDRKSLVSWSRTFVFFGDERFVPHASERSNYALAYNLLLGHVPIPPSRVFSVPTHLSTAAEAATNYSVQLATFFSTTPTNPPEFDLILLGMGEDGHVASLFPGSPALDVENAWATSSRPTTTPPFVDRVTFTYPTINAARNIAFLISGEQKAEILRDVLEGQVGRDVRPAAGVQPTHGTLTWLVDRAAARLLKQ